MAKFDKARRKRKGYKMQKKGKKKPASVKVNTLFKKGRSYGVHPDPFPTRLLTRMKYVTTGELYSNSLTADTCGTEHVYRCTSIYDPYYGSGGTTTVGWSNYAAIYQKYIVYGAKIEIEFYDPAADGGVPIVSLNQLSPVQNQTTKTIGEQMLTYTSIVNNTGSQKKRFYFYVKPWALEGLSKLEWLANKSTRSSVMASNPSVDVYIRLGYASGVTASPIQYSIRIIYFTELFDRYQLTSTVVA